MKCQIVVARYNENIDYLKNLKNIIIVYNKGSDHLSNDFHQIKLPNIGREAHTYLYHIIQNYEHLAEKTLFIQGNLTDHKTYPLLDYFQKSDFTGVKVQLNTDMLKKKIEHHKKYLINLKTSKYTPFEWIQLIGFDISNLQKFEMVWGANFSVSKETILKKPKIFYENLIKWVEHHVNPEEGHFFERSWNIIFTHPAFIEKKKIVYHSLPDLSNRWNLTDIENDQSIEEIHLWNHQIINDDFYMTKYIESIYYIPIYPLIVNNSFELNLMIHKNIFLLLEFDNNTQYELYINHTNIVLFDLKHKKTIENKKHNYLLDKINLKIDWTINDINILINNNVFKNILVEEGYMIERLESIQIKSSFRSYVYLDYQNNNNTSQLKKIYYMKSHNNPVDSFFYNQHFINYYTQFINHSFF